MNQTAVIAQQKPSSTKMLRAMVGIGLLCALLIVGTYEGTKPIIESNRNAALEAAILQVLPGAVDYKTYVINEHGDLVLKGAVPHAGKKLYRGYDGAEQPVGFAIEASGQGYADIIRILYGYDPKSQKVIGFHVLESKETPGLGDKIEKDPAFLANFEALDVSRKANGEGLKHEVVAVKAGEKTNAWEVEGITGATISSRAIADMINESLEELSLPTRTSDNVQ